MDKDLKILDKFSDFAYKDQQNLINKNLNFKNLDDNTNELDYEGLELYKKQKKILLDKFNLSSKANRKIFFDENPSNSPKKIFDEFNFCKNKELDNKSKNEKELENRLAQKNLLKKSNDLAVLENCLNRMPINLLEQFEIESSSSEPNHEWQLDSGEFVLQCLNRHNFYRKLHNIPIINLSKNLIKYAKDWVDIIARNDRLERRYSNRFGENVFVMKLDKDSKGLNGAIPVDHWYQKGKNYNYESIHPKPCTSEFTQLIWKSTRYFGVACARSKTNKIYVVASYGPCGNFPHQCLENVLPPKPIE